MDKTQQLQNMIDQSPNIIFSVGQVSRLSQYPDFLSSGWDFMSVKLGRRFTAEQLVSYHV